VLGNLTSNHSLPKQSGNILVGATFNRRTSLQQVRASEAFTLGVLVDESHQRGTNSGVFNLLGRGLTLTSRPLFQRGNHSLNLFLDLGGQFAVLGNIAQSLLVSHLGSHSINPFWCRPPP